jgi:hypothetical protein
MVAGVCDVLRGCVVRRICNSRKVSVLVLSREVDFGRSRKQTLLTVGGENHALLPWPRACPSFPSHFMFAQLLSLTPLLLFNNTAHLTPLDTDWKDS